MRGEFQHSRNSRILCSTRHRCLQQWRSMQGSERWRFPALRDTICDSSLVRFRPTWGSNSFIDHEWRDTSACAFSVISRNSTSKSSIRVEFLDSVSDHVGFCFYFVAIDIETESSLRQHTLYNSWSNAFDLKEKVEVEVSKRHSYFRDLSKKVAPKVAHPYSL